MVRKANIVMALLMVTLVSCASVGMFQQPSQSSCDKIAYYDQYVETARTALFGLQFIPGIAQYIGVASSALVAIDIAMDEAQAQCDLAAQGKVASTRAALDSVWAAIQSFNAAYGEIKAIIKVQK